MAALKEVLLTSELFMLSRAQMRRIEPYFPLPHGVPRVDEWRILSGIVFVIRNGLRWRDAPAAYGPHKTIYNRFMRWSRLGVFNKLFSALAATSDADDVLMIDATHLKAASYCCQHFKKGSVPRYIGRTKGRLNSKLHAVCDGAGRLLILCLTEGQMSDHIDAKLTYPAFSGHAKCMIGDEGYNSDEYRAALKAQGITACIPPQKGELL